MRAPLYHAAWLVLVGGAAACDSDTSEVDGGTARQGGAGQCAAGKPPSIHLVNAAGTQIGVQGSYCACGGCADRVIWPMQATIVHAGDQVTFSMPAGSLVPGLNCTPPCPPLLHVQDPCASSPYEHRPVEEDLPWELDLARGVYLLWVDSHFTGDDGSSGQTYVGFGLVVDDGRERAIIDTSLGCDDEGEDAG